MNEAALQRFLDESELRNLIQSLLRALDDRDFDALGPLYTEDGVREVGGRIYRGRREIVEGPKKFLAAAYEATFHHLGQVYVDIDGDDATIVASIVAYHLPKVAEPARHEDGGGKYHATARRTEEGWRLTNVSLEMILFQGEPMTLKV
jgi:uncharacterized protein (TIGR02246 family)